MRHFAIQSNDEEAYATRLPLERLALYELSY